MIFQSVIEAAQEPLGFLIYVVPVILVILAPLFFDTTDTEIIPWLSTLASLIKVPFLALIIYHFYQFSYWQFAGGFLLYYIVGLMYSLAVWNHAVIKFKNGFLSVKTKFLIDNELPSDWLKNKNWDTGLGDEDRRRLGRFHNMLREAEVIKNDGGNYYSSISAFMTSVVPRAGKRKMELYYDVLFWPTLVVVRTLGSIIFYLTRFVVNQYKSKSERALKELM